MAQIRFFGRGPKIWSDSILWQRFCVGMVSTTSLSLSMRGRYKNEIVEWKLSPIFQKKRVRYARADELELCSSSTTSFTREAKASTYVEVLLFLFTHCRWMNTNTDTARQKCASLSLYTTCRTTYRHRTDVWWLPKFHGGFERSPLFHNIKGQRKFW